MYELGESVPLVQLERVPQQVPRLPAVHLPVCHVADLVPLLRAMRAAMMLDRSVELCHLLSDSAVVLPSTEYRLFGFDDMRYPAVYFVDLRIRFNFFGRVAYALGYFSRPRVEVFDLVVTVSLLVSGVS